MNTSILKNKTIVITRSSDQSKSYVDHFNSLESIVLQLPLLKINRFQDAEALEDVWETIATYEWIVFTSANGVNYFFDYFFKRFNDIRCIGPAKFACVGASTASAIKAYYLEVDLVPIKSDANQLLQELLQIQSLEHSKILVVTGNLNDPTLVSKLETDGHAIVDALQVYETHFEAVASAVDYEIFIKSGADVILFTSASAVESFRSQAKNLQLLPDARRPIIASIGSSTTEILKKYGLTVAVEPPQPNLEALTYALEHYFKTY